MEEYLRRYWDDPITAGYYDPPQQQQPKKKVVSIPVLDGSVNNQTFQPSVKTPEPPSEEVRLAAAVRIQRVLRGFLARKNVRTVRNVERRVEEIGHRLLEGSSRDAVAKDEKERLKANETLMSLLFKLDSVHGARDYRRKVIRRAIALQEMIDAIPTIHDEKKKKKESDGDIITNGGKSGEQEEDAVVAVGSEDEGDGGGSEVLGVQSSVMEEKKDEEVALKGLVERMAEENGRLRGMVGEMLRRTKEQSGLMRGLSRRVEQLERRVDKLGCKRKSKKQCVNSPCNCKQ